MLLLIFEDDPCALKSFLIHLRNARSVQWALSDTGSWYTSNSLIGSSSLSLATSSTASSVESIIWPNSSSSSGKLQWLRSRASVPVVLQVLSTDYYLVSQYSSDTGATKRIILKSTKIMRTSKSCVRRQTFSATCTPTVPVLRAT